MWISGLKELKGLCQGCPIMPMGSLSSDVLERRMLNGSRLFALLSRDFKQMFGQIVSIRMKTLSNTNMAASRLIKAHFRLMCVVQKRRCLSFLTTRPSPYSLKQNHNFVSNKYVSQALNAITNNKNKLLKTVRLASF